MSVQEFASNVDIGNRACQFVGDFRLNSFQDPSPQAREIAFAYDKLRLAELQRIVWKFATRRAVLRPINPTVMQLIPAAWSATLVYTTGSIVSYNNMIWVSQGWPPVGVTPDVSLTWVPYFGPMTINQWLPTINSDGSTNPGTNGYFAGELVYTPATENYTVYVSLSSSNTDTPGAYPNWINTVVYNRGDTVMYPAGGQLLSEPGDILVTSTGGIPVSSGATGPWQSTKDLNTTIPGSDPSWVPAPVVGQQHTRVGQNWLQLDSTLQSIDIIYPIGTGPSTQNTTRNVYRLPNGYLKHAPDIDNPNEIVRVMGILSAAPSDAQFENGYMITSEVRAIMLRFIADMTDVTQMDNLFCEALAARIALDVGPTIVPKEERNQALARVARRYKEAIIDARANDAVERGASAQPQSQYATVRF